MYLYSVYLGPKATTYQDGLFSRITPLKGPFIGLIMGIIGPNSPSWPILVAKYRPCRYRDPLGFGLRVYSESEGSGLSKLRPQSPRTPNSSFLNRVPLLYPL